MPDIRNPKAYLAAIGRGKYGKERYQEMSARGRSRAATARAKGKKPEKTYEVGGGGTFAAGYKMIRQGKMGRLRKLLGAKSPTARAAAARSAA